MSSTLSKILKITALLCVCVLLLTGCAKRTKDIEGADQVCVGGAYSESYMFIISDQAVVDELVSMYNSIKYKETDKLIDAYSDKNIYNLTFSKGNTTLGSIIINDELNFVFNAGEHVYHIESEFDYDRFEELLEKDDKNEKEAKDKDSKNEKETKKDKE